LAPYIGACVRAPFAREQLLMRPHALLLTTCFDVLCSAVRVVCSSLLCVCTCLRAFDQTRSQLDLKCIALALHLLAIDRDRS
jgi:hypothetical protein